MKEKRDLLGTEQIGPLLTRLAVPATIGMIVNALYNLADTIFIGRFVGPKALGGLAIAFPIQMLMGGFGLMIGMGAASAVSRFLGADKEEKAYTVVGNAFISVWVISLLFLISGQFFLEPVLKLFGATPGLMPFAKSYMRIIFFGGIFLTSTMVSNNLIRAEGNAKTAMIIMIIGTGSNLILDPLFIAVFGWGIRGAAIATITSQFLGFLYAMNYFRQDRSSLEIALKYFKLKKEIVKEIFVVGLPTLMRNIAGSLLAITANNSIGYYGGDLAISAFGVLNRFTMFILMPMFGLVQGFQPIAGFNYGAGKFQRVRLVTKTALIRVIIYSCVIAFFVMIFPNFFIKLFSRDKELIRIGTTIIRYIYFFLPLIGVQIIAATLFQALGKAKPALLISMLRQTLLLVPLILLIPRITDLGLTGIWLAFPISDAIAISISAVLLVRQYKRIN